MRRCGWAVLGLLLPGSALAQPAHQLFVEASVLCTFGGRGHLGLGVGAHYSVLPFGRGLDLGPALDLRWVRFRQLSGTLGTRAGLRSAYSGYGGYESVVGGNVDLGWTVRTGAPGGLRLGGGATLYEAALRMDGLIWVPGGSTAPSAGAHGTLPLANWAGSGNRDVTLSGGIQLGVIPRYYLLTNETPVPPATGTSTTPIE